MNEGLGSAVIIVIIVVFIVLVSSYMAFQINYTKAFRMKNKIIDLYEKYNGDACYNDSTASKCVQDIKAYANEIGYDPDKSLACQEGYSKKADLYCVKEMDVNTAVGGDMINDLQERHYYRVATRIDIRIPIFDNLLGFRVFTITGDTKVIGIEK